MAKTPASSKPNYPIPWIATYFITGLVLIAGSFVVVWYVSQFSSDYDYNDPDMTFLEQIVVSADPRRGDFTHLNGGNWKALCLVGWQANLTKAIAVAKLPPASAEAFIEEHEARAGDMEPSEFLLLYTNKAGAAKALTHPHGFAFAREGKAACIMVSKAILQLPAGNPL